MVTAGLIGLGVMGSPMAVHLARGLTADGGRLLVHSRRRESAAEALAAGAQWADSPAELARAAQVVVLVVADGPQIDAVLNGPQGLLAGVGDAAGAGVGSPLTIVVSATVSPAYVRELDDRTAGATGGLARVVDAPVSGGETGARAGTLSIMVGGSPERVAATLPVLAYAGRPVHLGPLGSGEVAKACNQLICAAELTAIAEATVVAERAGLDVGQLLDLLQGGYADSTILRDKATRFATKDYTVSGPAKFWIKDLRAYLDEAERAGVRSVQADRLLATVSDLTAAGLGDLDTAVLQRWIAERPS